MASAEIRDRIEFAGHRNIIGLHFNTLELTTESEISKKADCIIGVASSKSCSTLFPDVRTHLRLGLKVLFNLRVRDLSFSFAGRGDKKLELADEKELVLRKSTFVSVRTCAIECTAAAIDIPRPIIRSLKNPAVRGVLEIRCIPSVSAHSDIPPTEKSRAVSDLS